MSVFKGDASALRDVGLGNTRRFSLRTENVSGAPANRATWQLDAGGSVTLFYKEEIAGAAPPGVAETVILRVYYETGVGLLIKELHNAAPPADGATFTFFGTDTGDSGGSPRCGTVRLYVQAIRNAVVAYNVDSDTAEEGDQGALQVRMASPTHSVSAYPAGAKFAYGTAANEDLTITLAHTQRYADRNVETVRIDALDVSAQQVAGSTQEVGAGTTTQAFTANATNFDAGLKTYGSRITIIGNSVLLTAELWTTIGTGSATSHDRTAYYDVDPDITFVSVSIGQSIYNRSETATHQFGLNNSRSEALTRSVSWTLKDGAGATLATLSGTGPTYSNSRAIGATERASFDLVGDQWTIAIATADARATNPPNVYKVSRKWQLSTVSDSINGNIFTGKASSPTSDTATSRNRGQTLFFKCFVFNVRGELLASPTINFNVRPTGSETFEETNDTEPLVSGEFTGSGASYIVDTNEATGGKTLIVADQTTSGTNQARTGVAGNGNFSETSTSTPEWTVSSTYTVEVRTQKEATRNSDPEDIHFTIGEDVIYAYCQVLDSIGDPVNTVIVNFDLLDPDAVSRQTDSATTNSGGDAGWTPAAGFDTRIPAGSGWVMRCTITTHNGNTGTNDQSISMLSAFTANKNVSLIMFPKADPGRWIRPQESFSIFMSFYAGGTKTSPDTSPAPSVAIARKKSGVNDIEYLQTNGTWSSSPVFFTMSNSGTQPGTWSADVGPGEGIDTPLSAFTEGAYGVLAALYYNGQEFRDDEDFYIVGTRLDSIGFATGFGVSRG